MDSPVYSKGTMPDEYDDYDDGSGDISLGGGIVLRGGPGVMVVTNPTAEKLRAIKEGRALPQEHNPGKPSPDTPSMWDHLDEDDDDDF